MKKNLRVGFLTLILLAMALFYFYPISWDWLIWQVGIKKTVSERLAQYQTQVEGRLRSNFQSKSMPYPPVSVTLVFFKNEGQLKLYSGSFDSDLKIIKTYPVLAASGKSGPKLREGDFQVPEGVYRIESLNPNSTYHLSLKLNYPNAFDKKKAELEGRTMLGTDIMIHGSNVSAGCLAIGDAAIEELLVLAALSKYQNWNVILAPNDLRKANRNLKGNEPSWVAELDTQIVTYLLKLTD